MASLLFISLTGCVSAKYKMADEGTPPPVPLNITAASYPVEGAVDTVIIFGGPGAWKREAYWDEYELTVTNRSGTSVTLESATLIDLHGNAVMPGDNPWDLQEQSKGWIENYDSGTSGVVLKVGAASAVMTGAIVGVVTATGLSGAYVAGASVSAAAVAPIAAVVALPIIGIGTILVNVEGKMKIEEEFQRRRLVLPAIIQPDQPCRGSLFFRVAPGPKHLTLLFSGPDSKFEIPFDLSPLADLHLGQPPEPKPPE